MKLVDLWRDISIAKKLSFVVGIMALLIVGELATLRFAMHTLSAARAFVGGEGLWSKSQKNAAISLQRYGATRDEADFQAFLTYMQVPEGDHVARLELFKPGPDLAVVRGGFLRGRIDPADIDPMIDLLRRFHSVSYLARAIQIWSAADEMLGEFKTAGLAYRAALMGGDRGAITHSLAELKRLNERLTTLEDEFSYTLGVGSRWLEHVVLTLLSLAVLAVESFGLTLTFLTSRSISRGLRELNAAAVRIGGGDFTTALEPRSRDELGQLARSVRQMGQLLDRSYAQLETRVKERTAELENFMSIASHELNTPLTSLQLQLQMAKQKVTRAAAGQAGWDAVTHALEVSESQVVRLGRLVGELLDVSRIKAGKLTFTFQHLDLSALVREAASRLDEQLARVGSTLALDVAPGVAGAFDRMRIEQVIDNLLINALKYAAGKPVRLSLTSDGHAATLVVQDEGPGIAPEKQATLFDRFTRGDSDSSIGGLGLGLFIVREIVAGQGGSIRLDSQPGEGARFVVRLPLQPPLS